MYVGWHRYALDWCDWRGQRQAMLRICQRTRVVDNFANTKDEEVCQAQERRSASIVAKRMRYALIMADVTRLRTRSSKRGS